MLAELPIDPDLPRIATLLRSSAGLVVQAPPGAGKTTRIPPYLWQQGLLGDGQLVLVQPRRLAARSAAARIADEGQWRLGREIGYHVRFDRRASRATRLLAATEGVLLRRLQTDPLLSDVSVVVLDEFHERRLDTDLILGMVRRIQQTVRPELRLLVMSATLDAEPVARFLECPVVSSPGRAFPVRIKYFPAPPRRPLAEQSAQAVRRAVESTAGDVLVFLPGVGEIRQTERALAGALPRERYDMLPLYGDLRAEEQDRVLLPSPRRKVILATNVAETSVTIDGVRVVIDTGWARVMRFDAHVGLNRLSLETISQASAEQRAGRAGRTAPGECWRLWDEAAHRGRAEALEPEIQRIDLSSAVLQLHAWGERSVMEFPWLEPPRLDAVEAAERLLQTLGALTPSGVTDLGRRMAALPVEPRIARLLEEGRRLQRTAPAALAAAILSERDIVERDSRAPSTAERRSGPRGAPPTRGAARTKCDITDRVEAVLNFISHRQTQTDFGALRPAAVHQVLRVARQLTELVKRSVVDEAVSDDSDDADVAKFPAPAATSADASNIDAYASAGSAHDDLESTLQHCLLAAFPDRLARRRAPQQSRGLMVGGKGVKLTADSRVTQGDWFLCLDCSGLEGGDTRVRLASCVSLEMLPQDLIEEREVLFFHPSQQQVVARKQRLWLDLVLQEIPQAAPAADAVAELLFQHAAPRLDQVFPSKSEECQQLVARIQWLGPLMPELDLPAMDEPQLREVLRDLCQGRRSFDDLRQAPWTQAIAARLSGQQWAALQREAPSRFETPGGARVKLTYEAGKPPVLAVKIQDIFGWRDTPRLAHGRAPVLLHLLGPNMRCQQVTDDLASFWSNAYPQLRRELKRRYPKHAWPENPTIPADG